MNIAFFLTPKVNVAYIHDDYTLRQGMEKMRHHGYTSVPVISKDGKYVGVLSEGDLLWYIVDKYREDDRAEFKAVEKKKIRDLLSHSRRSPNKIIAAPVRITAQIDELVETAMRQNFVPVIDDNDLFIGIVTRRAIIKQLYEDGGEQEKMVEKVRAGV